MKNLHWKSIPKTKIRNTFWSEIESVELGLNGGEQGGAGNASNDAISLAMQNEILDLFSLSPTKETPCSTPRKELRQAPLQSLIDSKRSNNTCMRWLTVQFRDCSDRIIANDLCVLIDLDFLSSQRLAILLSQFKMPHAEIKNAVLSLDSSKLTADQIATLRYMFPLSQEEV